MLLNVDTCKPLIALMAVQILTSTCRVEEATKSYFADVHGSRSSMHGISPAV